MKVTTRRRCGCRDETTNKQWGGKCPRLIAKEKNHGTWGYRISVPPDLRHLVGGRAVVTESGFSLAKDARTAGDKIVDRLKDAQEITGLTVEKYLTEWLKGKNGIEKSTLNNYAGHVRLHLIPHLGHYLLDQLRPAHISAAYDAILVGTAGNRQPVTPATIARINGTLSSALGSAVKVRQLPWNPAQFVELPKFVPRKRRPWSAEELGTFLDAAADDWLYVMYLVMAFAGMRRGQAVGLQWDGVNLSRGTITLRENHVDVNGRVVIGSAKSEGSDDLVLDLDSGTAGALLGHQMAQEEWKEKYGSDYRDGGYVFCWPDGRPLLPEYVTRHMQTLARRAGLVATAREAAPAGASEIVLSRKTYGHPRGAWTLYRDRAPIATVEIVDLARTRTHATATLGAPLPVALAPGDELGAHLLPKQVLHGLRHGAASLEMDAGADMAVISKRRGHSSQSFTSSTYAHLRPGGAGARAAEAAAALVPRAGRPAPAGPSSQENPG